MKKGFTIIETMIVVIIGMIVIGTGITKINSFLIREELDKAASELANMLKLAKNYAITSQRPNEMVTDLNNVRVNVSESGVVTAEANLGVGGSYFVKNISSKGVSLNQATFIFSSPEGKLVSDIGVPLGIDETVAVVISHPTSEVGYEVCVSSGGIISENKKNFEERRESPTATPTPTPVCYTRESTCCWENCKSFTCNALYNVDTRCYTLVSCGEDDFQTK
ncbi:MAG TPA: hypothetical protein PK639_02845 [Candidatus Woesebacteria bacterium]|nr:hypothetical protein [Candidatus Woesebacteria bacterium]